MFVLLTALITSNQALAACSISLVGPADATTKSQSPSFRWDGDCVRYRLQFSADGSFGADLVNTAWTTREHRRLGENLWDDYQAAGWADGVSWRVRGQAADGSVTTSASSTVFMDPDYDDDGSSLSEADCDDLDATVFPGAVEVQADGIDQDCDGDDPIETLVFSNVLADRATNTHLFTLLPSEAMFASMEAEGDAAFYYSTINAAGDEITRSSIQACASVCGPIELQEWSHLDPDYGVEGIEVVSMVWALDSYTLTVDVWDRLGANEAGDSLATATVLTLPDSVRGNLRGEEGSHYFQMDLAPGETLHVTGTVTGDDSVGAPWTLRLYDTAGVELGGGIDSGSAYGSDVVSGSWTNGATTQTVVLVIDPTLGDSAWQIRDYSLNLTVSGP